MKKRGRSCTHNNNIIVFVSRALVEPKPFSAPRDRPSPSHTPSSHRRCVLSLFLKFLKFFFFVSTVIIIVLHNVFRTRSGVSRGSATRGVCIIYIIFYYAEPPKKKTSRRGQRRDETGRRRRRRSRGNRSRTLVAYRVYRACGVVVTRRVR